MTALAALQEEVRWVAWRNEQRGGKPTKVPYGVGGHHAKADDPATWVSKLDATLLERQIANGSGGGTGLMLGDLGAGMFLAGVDLDSCLDKAGDVAGWAENIITAVGSYSETSPSSKGIKIFFLIESTDVRPFLDRIGVLPNQWGCRRGIPGLNSRDHGAAIEVYTAARYFAVTGQRWPSTPDNLQLLDAAALEQLAALIPPPARGGAHASGTGGDSSRSAVAYRKGIALRRAGKTYEQMMEALLADPETAAWARETFDVGMDTRTGVDDHDYQPPFRFTGKLTKLTYKLGPEQLTEADRKTMHAAIIKAKD